MTKFTNKQRERILGATFEIAEMMDELDDAKTIMTPDGPKEHPRYYEIEEGIGFILSDFNKKEQEEISCLVNHQRGIEV